MQKILSYISMIVAAMTTTGCASQFDIAGNSNLSIVDGHMMYLCVSNTPQEAAKDLDIDSCRVEHGRFRFAGDMDSVVFAHVRLNNGLSLPIVLEEAPITVRIDAVGPTVEGGTLNKQLYAFLQKRDRMENQITLAEQEFIHALRRGDDDIEKQRERFEKLQSKMEKEIEDAETKFVKDNFHNVLGPGYFMMLCNQNPLPVLTDQLRSIADAAPAAFVSNPQVHSYLVAAGYEYSGKKHKKKKK